MVKWEATEVTQQQLEGYLNNLQSTGWTVMHIVPKGNNLFIVTSTKKG